MTTARYEIIRQLACGGMAEVLLARRTPLEGDPTLVVIKRVLPHLSQADGFMRMFATESRIASQLMHPNIVAVLEVGEMDSLPFIAMERLDGADLLRLLQQCVLRRQQLGTAVAMAIVAGAARGLGYAHRARARDGRPLKIIHRDVSPHNIFVTRDGGVKLLDFGIAKSAAQASHTTTGQVKGKISYMSPEQIRARPLSARSDLWSLGVVLWESVAGEKLFTRDNDAATLHAILHDPVPRLNRPDMPGLDDLIAAVLQRDPDRRIGTAEEIAQQIERLLLQAGLSAVSKLVAQRVASLVPALNPEIDVARPATARNPEVVSFAIGPAAAGMRQPADRGGAHRRLSLPGSADWSARPEQEDEDPTLLEIAAPPPDPDFDAEATVSRDDRPMVGESTDTHTIPLQRPVLATGTLGTAQPALGVPDTRHAVTSQSGSTAPKPVAPTPIAVPNRRATQMFSGGAASAPSPSAPLSVADAVSDDSLTIPLGRSSLPPPRAHAAPVVRSAPSGASVRVPPPRVAPPSTTRVPPPLAAKPPAPPVHRPPAARDVVSNPPAAIEALDVEVDVDDSLEAPDPKERVSVVSLVQSPSAPPPRPPVTSSGRPSPPPVPPAPEHAQPAALPSAASGVRPSHTSSPPALAAPAPAPSSVFGDVPARPLSPQPLFDPPPSAPPQSSPFGAMPKYAPLPLAESSQTIQRKTTQLISTYGATRRTPGAILIAIAGLCLVAGAVVLGAWATGVLRADDRALGAQAATTSSSPALARAAPVAPTSVPAVVPEPSPTPTAAPTLPLSTPPTPAFAQEAPPTPSAPRGVPPAGAVVTRAPAAAPAPRTTPRPVANVAPRPQIAARPTQAPINAPRPGAARRTTAVRDPFPSIVPRPAPLASARPRPASPATPRRPPSVRAGGIFTDL